MKQTKKSTKSVSKKPKQSLRATTQLKQTKTTAPKAKSAGRPLGSRTKAGSSGSPGVKELKVKSKLSPPVLSKSGYRIAEKSNRNVTHEELRAAMLEIGMSPKEIARFKSPSPEKAARFREMAENTRKFGPGRPKKAAADKEKPVAIRFSETMLEKIRGHAKKLGMPWQTFLKQAVMEKIEKAG